MPKRVLKRGTVLRISVALQQQYISDLATLTDHMITTTEAEIRNLFHTQAALEHFGTGMDATLDAQVRILVNSLKRRFDQVFKTHAKDISNRMVDKVNRSSSTSVGTSTKDFNLKEASKAFTIDVSKMTKQTRTILKNAVNRSVDFIQTIPEHHLNKVSAALYKSIAEGGGIESLEKDLQQFNTGTKSWVHNTAMDQTRKAYNGLNTSRMQSVGVTTGEWIHSAGSQHPRELHVEFDGKIFDLSEGAPIGDDGGNVLPGDDPNCRCTFVPVLTSEDTPEENENDEQDDEE